MSSHRRPHKMHARVADGFFQEGYYLFSSPRFWERERSRLLGGRKMILYRFPRPVPPMSEVTRILSAIDQGDPQAAEQLLPLVYDELRKLAAQKLAHEKPGQTLQATALVHEAYLRLVDSDQA